jgi:mannosyltransferase
VARTEVIVLCALTALAGALRFAALGAQGYWFDETVTVGLLGMSFEDMLREIPDSESTPPLYYVLAWLWAQPFGLGEAGLRALSALCGTAAVPAAYMVARELCNRRVALVTGAFAAVSPFLVWYSQEARSYALLTLLSALSLWLLARLLRRFSARDAALWALVCALALATHYFALFLVASQAVWLIVAAGSRKGALLAIGAVGAAGAALLPLALSQESAGFAAFIADDSLLGRLALTAKQLALGYDSPLEPVTAGLAAAIALGGIALALTRAPSGVTRGARVAAGVALGCFVLPLLLAAAGTDYVLARNLIVAWVPLAIVVAAGLTSPRAGRIGAAALAVLLLLALVSTIGVPLEPDWQRGDWGAASGGR